jgi:hypothetical protein
MANLAAAIALWGLFLVMAALLDLPETWNAFQIIGARVVLGLIGAMFVATGLPRR